LGKFLEARWVKVLQLNQTTSRELGAFDEFAFRR
jgi:hypothetical protein